MATKKSNMQLWVMLALIVVIIVVLLFLPSCGNRAKSNEAEATTLVKVGDVAPNFSVRMFDGDGVTLSTLKGKVVLLNFWATWCPPCREELTRVQHDLIDRFAGQEFVFLPISRGEEREAVAAFRQTTGYTFPMGLDSDRAVYDLYASNYIPRNFLIDAQGKVVMTTVGYEPEEFDALIQTIAHLLKQ